MVFKIIAQKMNTSYLQPRDPMPSSSAAKVYQANRRISPVPSNTLRNVRGWGRRILPAPKIPKIPKFPKLIFDHHLLFRVSDILRIGLIESLLPPLHNHQPLFRNAIFLKIIIRSFCSAVSARTDKNDIFIGIFDFI